MLQYAAIHLYHSLHLLTLGDSISKHPRDANDVLKSLSTALFFLYYIEFPCCVLLLIQKQLRKVLYKWRDPITVYLHESKHSVKCFYIFQEVGSSVDPMQINADPMQIPYRTHGTSRNRKVVEIRLFPGTFY